MLQMVEGCTAGPHHRRPPESAPGESLRWLRWLAGSTPGSIGHPLPPAKVHSSIPGHASHDASACRDRPVMSVKALQDQHSRCHEVAAALASQSLMLATNGGVRLRPATGLTDGAAAGALLTSVKPTAVTVVPLAAPPTVSMTTAGFCAAPARPYRKTGSNWNVGRQLHNKQHCSCVTHLSDETPYHGRSNKHEVQ